MHDSVLLHTAFLLHTPKRFFPAPLVPVATEPLLGGMELQERGGEPYPVGLKVRGSIKKLALAFPVVQESHYSAHNSKCLCLLLICSDLKLTFMLRSYANIHVQLVSSHLRQSPVTYLQKDIMSDIKPETTLQMYIWTLCIHRRLIKINGLNIVKTNKVYIFKWIYSNWDQRLEKLLFLTKALGSGYASRGIRGIVSLKTFFMDLYFH